MAELTAKQLEFIEKHLKIPRVVGRKDAKAKKAAWSQEFRDFNDRHALVQSQVNVILDRVLRAQLLSQLAEAEVMVMQRPEQPNFDGGRRQLDEVLRSTQNIRLAIECKQEIARVMPLVERVLATQPDNGDAIRLMRDFANDTFAAGYAGGSIVGDGEKLRSVISTMPRLEEELKRAEPKAPGAASTAEVDRIKAELELFAALRAPRAALAEQTLRFENLQQRLETAFAAGLPPVLSAQPAPIRTALTVAEDAKPPVVQQAADDARGLIDKLETDAKEPLKALARYQDALAACMKGAHAVLTAHSAAAHGIVSPKLAAADLKLQEAAAAVAQHDWDGATALVGQAVTAAEEGVDIADVVARHLAVRADRIERMAPLIAQDIAQVQTTKAKAALNKARATWNTADQAFASNDPVKLRNAVPLLERLPQEAAEATKLIALEGDYVNTASHIENSLPDYRNQVNALPVGLRAAANLLVDGLEALLNEGKYQTTRDLRVSQSLLAKSYPASLGVKEKLLALKRYADAKEAFELRRQEVAGHSAERGFFALQAYATRLDNDELHAAGLVTRSEHELATGIYAASESGHAEALTALVPANEYADAREAVEAEVLLVKALPRADAAADALGAAAGLLAEAHRARLRGAWDNAKSFVAMAEAQVNLARSVADNADILDSAASPAVIQDVDVDPQAAFDGFDAAYDQLEKADVFKGRLSAKGKAAAKLKTEAQAAAGRNPPDFAGARQLLAQAMEILQDTVRVWEELPKFEGQLAHLEEQLKIIHKGKWNTNKYFTQDIEQAKTLRDAAKQDAKANPPDYGAAHGKLAQAITLAYSVFERQHDYVKALELRPVVQSGLDELNSAKSKSLLTAEIARLQGLLTEFDNALDASDPVLAKKKALEAEALIPGLLTTASWGSSYVETVENELKPALARLPTTQVYSAAERQQLEALRLQIEANATARSFAAAREMIWELEALELECRRLETLGADYTAAHTPVRANLVDLRQRMVLGAVALETELAALEARLKAAEDAAALKNYRGAIERLVGLPEAAAALATRLDARLACDTARKEAVDALTELDKLPRQDAIEPLVVRVRGQQTNAIALADTGDSVGARAMFVSVARDVNEAIRTAAQFAEYRELTSQAAALSQDDVDGLDTALRRAQSFVDDLKSQPEAMFIFSEVGLAQASIDRAGRFAKAQPQLASLELGKAADACNAARLAVGLYTQLRASERGAQADIERLLASHPQAAFVRDALQALAVRLQTAMNTVRQDPAQRPQAQTVVEEVIKETQKLRLVADAQVEVAALVEKISGRMDALEKHARRDAIKDQIAPIRKDLADGREQARLHQQPQALATLRRGLQRQDDALLQASMAGGEAPDQKTLKAMLARPDGPAALDRLVATLDPGTQRRVMNDVFQARFNCKLALYQDGKFVDKEMKKFITANPHATPQEIEAKEQEIKILDRSQNYAMQPDEKAPDIRRFYELMAKLPDNSTMDNDSLKVFTNKGGKANGSHYAGDRKEVCMNEGDVNATNYYGIGSPNELDSVDPDSKPVAGEKLSYFSWNTLHEVAHALDDKLGFMARRGEELGGWKEYGANVLPVATAIATHYDFDRDYLAALLSGMEDIAVPPPKPGVDAEEWERRRLDAQAHAARIRSGVKPWQSAASAKACSIGGICYQESYDGSWTSYPLAQRNKGVSGYQFRAPGEWFAELFAAFHSGKLNGAHPARAWLTTL